MMICAVNCRPLNGLLLFRFIISPLAPPARQRLGNEIFKAATEPSRLGSTGPGSLPKERLLDCPRQHQLQSNFKLTPLGQTVTTMGYSRGAKRI